MLEIFRLMEVHEDSGEKYEFSGIIAAHRSDVKCIVATNLGQIISGSRDECVKVFSQRSYSFTYM